MTDAEKDAFFEALDQRDGIEPEPAPQQEDQRYAPGTWGELKARRYGRIRPGQTTRQREDRERRKREKEEKRQSQKEQSKSRKEQSERDLNEELRAATKHPRRRLRGTAHAGGVISRFDPLGRGRDKSHG